MAVEGQVKLPREEALWEAAGVKSGTKLQQVDWSLVHGAGIDTLAEMQSKLEHTEQTGQNQQHTANTLLLPRSRTAPHAPPPLASFAMKDTGPQPSVSSQSYVNQSNL